MYNVGKYSRSVVTTRMSTLWVCLVVISISQTATSMAIAQDSIINATRPLNMEGVGGRTASYQRARRLPVAIPISSAKAKLGESNELDDEGLENPHRVKRVRRNADFNAQAEGYSSDYAYEEINPKSYKRKRLMFYTTLFCWLCWIAIAISILKALIMLCA